MNCARFRAVTAALMACWAGGGSVDAAVDFARDIRPVLKARCYACHGALKQKAGLRLDTVEAMRKGGESGTVIAAHAALLLGKVTAENEADRMPPEGAPLTPAQIAALREWIGTGAPSPPDDQPETDPRAHWAFQPPQRVSPPEVTAEWNGNLIDKFVAARHAAHGMKPQPQASRSLWLRRVYFDAIGLPPSPDEIAAFVADKSACAEASVVDRLLAMPQFGERWARHFMDIWRYSDWWGLDAQLRYSQKHIWHWRDWIVASLNADKGYDRMVLEMLAADELCPDDRDALRATGFLCRSYYLFNRTTWLDEAVEHTSRAFMGLTMQCVKCHDHKYDPLEHTDYYRLRAVFEPYHVRLDAWPGESDFEKDGLPRAFDLHPEAPTHLHRRGDDKQPDTSRVIPPGIPVLFGELTVAPVSLPVTAHSPGLLGHVLKDQLEAAEREIDKLRAAAAKENAPSQKQLVAALLRPAVLRAAHAADIARTSDAADHAALCRVAASAEAQWKLAVAEAAEATAAQDSGTAAPDKKAEAEKKHKSADDALAKAREAAASPGEAYTPLRGALKALEGPTDSFDKNPNCYPATSTGRRLAFARWLASPDNPLTARVAVNHVWTRVFGESFVPDVSDFGRRCPPPLHQDVLDSLAAEFPVNGWKLKPLLRTMLTSRLYRSTSSAVGADPAAAAADPDNKFLWRMNAKRLESQAIRDGLLHMAGILDLKTGGPPVPVPAEENSRRRALYFQQHGELEDRFLGTFDNVSVFDCYRRRESVTPQQALALANSKTPRECADALEKRLASAADDRAFITAAFTAILCRPATAAEQEAALDSLTTLRAAGEKADPARARALFLHALMNHNDYVTLR
jgi:Protein of unknown function (DUF1549)/Protein of unknown function (DUF1553)/Planctomycete cytochrome C